MAQRGKQLTAATEVIAFAPVGTAQRLEAPAHISDAERAIWVELVNDQPASAFTPTHGPLIEQYCRHVVQACVLADEIQNFHRAWLTDDAGLRRYDRLLGMEEREGRAASRNIAWIEAHCRIPEGRLVGKPVKLTRKQRAWIKRIYDTPTRLFILSMARKNAKTALSAFLLLLHLCEPEAKPNSQLYSAAQSREQTAILFALAAKVVRMSPDLSQYVHVRDTAKQLFCAELGTLYRALSADASTAYGLSPVFTVHDELGQVKGPRSELYEALETASATQEAPLSIVISTQAPTDADLLSLLIDDGLSGADPRIKVELHTAPLDMDPFSAEAIRCANPHFDEFMNQDEVFRQAADAKRMPSREASYRNLILNQRVEARNPFVTRSV